MVAPALRNVLSSTNSALLSQRLARRLIESSLTDRIEIEKFDASLAPEDPLNFDRETAGLIRAMYEQWADDVDSLLTRIAEVERRFGLVAEVALLQEQLGKTRAMLSISLDDMESGCRDIKEGRLHSAAEVRRELHLSTH